MLPNEYIGEQKQFLSFDSRKSESSWNLNNPRRLLKQISSFSFGLSRTGDDEPSISSMDNQSSYFLNVKDTSGNDSGSKRGIGAFANSKGIPSSTPSRLVLHVGTLTLEGLKKIPIRRRDLKVLKLIDPDVREIILEVFERVTVLDYEYNSSKAATSYINLSKVARARSKISKRFLKLRKKFGSSPRTNLLQRTNIKLYPFNVEALFVKREEKLVGTTATVYYLLFRNKSHEEDLPLVVTAKNSENKLN